MIKKMKEQREDCRDEKAESQKPRVPNHLGWIKVSLREKFQLPGFSWKMDPSKDVQVILFRITVALFFIRVNQPIGFVKPDPKVREYTIGQTDVHNSLDPKYTVQVTLHPAVIDQRLEGMETQSSLNKLRTRGGHILEMFPGLLKWIPYPRIQMFMDHVTDETFIAFPGEHPANPPPGIDPVDPRKTGVMGVKILGKLEKTLPAEIRRGSFDPSIGQ